MQPSTFSKRSVASKDGGVDMISSILDFLGTSPDRLLDDLSSTAAASESFFRPFLFCVLSPDVSIRQPAMNVAERLFNDHKDAFTSLERRSFMDARELRRELWSKRFVNEIRLLRVPSAVLTMRVVRKPYSASVSALPRRQATLPWQHCMGAWKPDCYCFRIFR